MESEALSVDILRGKEKAKELSGRPCPGDVIVEKYIQKVGYLPDRWLIIIRPADTLDEQSGRGKSFTQKKMMMIRVFSKVLRGIMPAS